MHDYDEPWVHQQGADKMNARQHLAEKYYDILN